MIKTFDILQCDVVTPSGIIFPRDEVEKAVSVYMDEYNKHNWMGVFANYSGKLELADVSHNVRDMVVRTRGNDSVVEAEIEILDTPNGRIVKQMLLAGIDMTLSPTVRGRIDAFNVISDITICNTVIDESSLFAPQSNQIDLFGYE